MSIGRGKLVSGRVGGRIVPAIGGLAFYLCAAIGAAQTADLQSSTFDSAVESNEPSQAINTIQTLPLLPEGSPFPKDTHDSFHFRKAIEQSMRFLAVQHAFRFASEDSTRANLMNGKFLANYVGTVESLRGWDDGDPFLCNYIAHPLMGAITGFIEIQNDPNGIAREVGLNRNYWHSRLRALAWSAAYSTQFELGPLSEASIGNVGLRPEGKAKHPMAYVDLVVTPMLGTQWLVGEDVLDRYLIRALERKIHNRAVQIVIRSTLNPSRSFSNLMQSKPPWHRNNRE